MGGFRRAQLRGSEELFRATTEADQAADLPAGEATVAATVTRPAPLTIESGVPGAPAHDSRSFRLSVDDIELITEALQRMKYPGKAAGRPSVDEFERLGELRQRFLDAL